MILGEAGRNHRFGQIPTELVLVPDDDLPTSDVLGGAYFLRYGGRILLTERE